MLEFLRGKASDRKLRLFACACCRRVQELHRPDGPHSAVQVGEAFADGLVGRSQLRTARRNVGGVGAYSSVASAACAAGASVEGDAATAARRAAVHAADYFGHRGVEEAGFDPASWKEVFPARRDAEWKVQAALLRCVIGNPLRTAPAIDLAVLAGNGGLVRRLAEDAYEQRLLPGGELDGVRLRVLADALEEAGPTDAEVLDHLRGPRSHVRGCFAVDLVLNRT
jgi:hypothetical protein